MTTTITRSTDSTSITPAFVLGPFQAFDEAGSLVHPILGRSADDVTLRPAKLGTGNLELYFLTADDAETARLFHRPAATFTVISDDGAFLPALYVPQRQIGRAQRSDLMDNWVLTVPYQEIQP